MKQLAVLTGPYRWASLEPRKHLISWVSTEMVPDNGDRVGLISNSKQSRVSPDWHKTSENTLNTIPPRHRSLMLICIASQDRDWTLTWAVSVCTGTSIFVFCLLDFLGIELYHIFFTVHSCISLFVCPAVKVYCAFSSALELRPHAVPNNCVTWQQ